MRATQNSATGFIWMIRARSIPFHYFLKSVHPAVSSDVSRRPQLTLLLFPTIQPGLPANSASQLLHRRDCGEREGGRERERESVCVCVWGPQSDLPPGSALSLYDSGVACVATHSEKQWSPCWDRASMARSWTGGACTLGGYVPRTSRRRMLPFPLPLIQTARRCRQSRSRGSWRRRCASRHAHPCGGACGPAPPSLMTLARCQFDFDLGSAGDGQLPSKQLTLCWIRAVVVAALRGLPVGECRVGTSGRVLGCCVVAGGAVADG